MKFILSITMLFSFIYADDLQRVNEIVEDITQLNKKYAVCQYNLEDANKREKIYKERITALENSIKELKSALAKRKRQQQQEMRIKTKASSYRVNKDANIYDGIHGKVIAKWERRTSFTSNQRTQNWIKITGFFVDRVWRPAKKEMWVRVVDAYKRPKVQ